jgi:LDH2 family malate/lactate/ureidoglycolate dehydrogenase
VAVLCQRTNPLIALPGFQGRAIGNNPLAFAMPVPDGVPLVFDMAMSEVARGKLNDAARDGVTVIPEGWAVDPEGRPTTDVQQALSGAMRPTGGHKGIGLAMLVECLAGSLAGALAADSHGQGPSGGSTGAFLLVANPALLAGQALYDTSVREWMGRYRTAAGATGRYPGERQARSEADRSVNGIPIAPALLRELQSLGERTRISFPS